MNNFALLFSLIFHVLLFLVVYQTETPNQDQRVEVDYIDMAEINPAEKTFIDDADPLKKAIEDLKSKTEMISKYKRRFEKQQQARKLGNTKNFLPSPKPLNRVPLEQQKPGPGKNQTQTRTMAIGESSINQMVPNVKEGSFTAINTDQYLYYSFYSRINRQIRYRWVNHIRRLAASYSMNNLKRLSRIPRVTQVEIVLTKEGEFLDSIIHKSSGDKFLDQATVDAFIESTPFLNPPEDLITDENQVHLHYSFRILWRPQHLANRR